MKLNSKHKSLYLLFGSLSVAGLFWVTINIVYPGNGLPGCMFRSVTGIPCPSCGITHSLMDIVNFNFTEAAKDNILGFPAIVMLAIVPVLILTDLLSGKNYFIDCYSRMEILLQNRKLLSGTLILLVTINWIYLILQK